MKTAFFKKQNAVITRASDDPKRPQNFWDDLGVIPIFWDDPNFSGVIWGQSQKNPKNPKATEKIGMFWDEFYFWDDPKPSQKIPDFLG